VEFAHDSEKFIAMHLSICCLKIKERGEKINRE